MGCRFLTLTYASSTTAQADDPAGMTDYTGRLVKVSFTAADPTNNNAIITTDVARYGYSSTGQLLGEWDQRVSPALVTQYSYDPNGRLASLTPPGLAPVTMGYNSSGQLLTATRRDPSLGQDAVTRVVYNVPTSGPGLPDLTAAQAASWGQASDTTLTETAVFPADHPASATPTTADWAYASLTGMDVNGREVNTAEMGNNGGSSGWQISSTRHDATGNDVWSLSAQNRNEALTPLASTDPAVAGLPASADRADALSDSSNYDPSGVDVVDSYGPTHTVTLPDGTTVDARPHSHSTYDQGAPAGGPFHLITTSTAAAQTLDGLDHDVLTSHNGYGPVVSGDPAGTDGWTLRAPTSSSTDLAAGSTPGTLVHTTRYDTLGRAIETRLPGAATSTGTSSTGTATDARTTVTSYYTATGTGMCVNPALAGLVCATGPAAQPTSGPNVPVTTSTYNLWYQPLVVTEKDASGTVLRTTTTSYDTAGRPRGSAVTASTGTVLPAVTYTYAADTGLPTSTSTGTGAGLVQISKTYDTFGRTLSYTDADAETTTTDYDIDGRPASSSGSKGSVSYGYDSTSGEHRGLLTSLNTGMSGAPSTFTASYDGNGQLLTQTYPSGLVATSSYDNSGSRTELDYGTSGAPTSWMMFHQTYDSQDRAATTASSASSQTYGYDQAGRLTQVADTDTSGSAACTVRSYGYDADSNRTGLVTTAPNANGTCAAAPTTIPISNSYDEADRITNVGYVHDPLGRTRTVPSSDVTGGADLNVGYYTNDLVAQQTQVDQQTQVAHTQDITVDPLQQRARTRTDNTTGLNETDHYSNDGDSPNWTSNTTAGTWTRNVIGIDGNLAATQDQNGHVILQLSNLHGDIVATAADDPSATGTSSYTESTEFGTP